MFLLWLVRQRVRLQNAAVQVPIQSLVPVVVTLEWAVITDIDVVRLLLSELGEVRTKRRQVRLNNLLNERLGCRYTSFLCALVVV